MGNVASIETQGKEGYGIFNGCVAIVFGSGFALLSRGNLSVEGGGGGSVRSAVIPGSCFVSLLLLTLSDAGTM
jgi:hypothetical protein